MAVSIFNRNRGIDREPYYLYWSSLTQDRPTLVADTATGSADPITNAVKGVSIYNAHATTNLRASATLRGMVSDDQYVVVPAAGTRLLPGILSSFWLMADGAAGGPADMQAEALYYGLPNDDGGHPGFGELPFDFTGGVNTTLTRTFTIQYPLTVTAITIYAPATPSSALGAYTLSATLDGVDLMSTATYDLEGLTGGTMATATLSTVSGALTGVRGNSLVVSTVSDNADLTNDDVYVGVEYTLG